MDATQQSWKLVSLSPLPGWALILLCAALVAGVVLACIGLWREPDPRRRALLWGLRVLAGLCALFFLLEPALRNLQVARAKNRVAVLVDRSASMNFPVEPNGPTRSSQVADALGAFAPQFEAMKDRYAFDVFGFDPELAPVTADSVRNTAPRAGRTDLLAALRALKAGDSSSSSRKLAGVMLLSDGADNVDLSSGLSPRTRAALEELGVPVSTFLVGQEGLKDIAIDQIKVDDFAFVRNSVTAEVELKGRGFKGETVSVVLKPEGRVVATQQVRFTSNEDSQTVAFTFTPDQTGRFVYTVSTPVFPDEAVPENNTRSFALKVIRDRMRVLLVSGRPSWDERFLRGLLKQDPNVELISFYILRNTGDNTGTVNDDRELSLIPFPMDEIFREKLDTFDVVLFLNFGYTEPGLSIATYERNLKDYISKGGALAVVGGDRSFGDSRFSFTVLAEALPVEAAGASDGQSFKARLTQDGQRHPVTALGTGSTSAEAAWNSLPAIPGFNLTRAKPGAVVLLDHPFTNAAGQSAPVLALWEYGRGRSMTLMTDASWYWAFTSHVGGAPSRHYERFWGNALRWLVRDPDLTTLQVQADPPSVEPGRPVGVGIVARLPDYQPAAAAEVTVELVAAEDGKVVGSQKVTAGPDGAAHVEFPPPPPGAYLLRAQAAKGGKALGSGQDALAVRAVGSELADAHVGSSLMNDIAKATGGKAFTLPSDTSLSSVPFLEPPLVEVGRSKDQPLWDRWYWLLTLVMIVGLEWGLRRRFGYV
ncbi:MAG: threonine dehydrogenase [Myxococcaceae bacterium]|nr:threonine dehydrogenase [Myxococcaceae bacterium]